MEWTQLVGLVGSLAVYTTGVCFFFYKLNEKIIKEWRDEHGKQIKEMDKNHREDIQKMDKKWDQLFNSMDKKWAHLFRLFVTKFKEN